MAPDQRQIDAAAARIAFFSRFPTFAGGNYAFSCDDLSAGAWLAPGDPCAQLAALAVEIPLSLRADAYELAHARCRILIEDALAARV